MLYLFIFLLNYLKKSHKFRIAYLVCVTFAIYLILGFMAGQSSRLILTSSNSTPAWARIILVSSALPSVLKYNSLILGAMMIDDNVCPLPSPVLE